MDKIILAVMFGIVAIVFFIWFLIKAVRTSEKLDRSDSLNGNINRILKRIKKGRY